MTAPPQQVKEQDRKGTFVHLDAAPVRLAIEPDVLRPMSIRLLYRHDISESRFGPVDSARRKERARGLDEVARPHEMIAAQILISLVEAPRYRQAGDYRSREGSVLMRCQHRGADAIAV